LTRVALIPLAAAATLGAALAAAPRITGEEHQHDGMIVSVDHSQVMLRKEVQLVALLVDWRTVATLNGERIEIVELKVGDVAHVIVERSDDAVPHALRIDAKRDRLQQEVANAICPNRERNILTQ
jgi:hypothetical protein